MQTQQVSNTNVAYDSAPSPWEYVIVSGLTHAAGTVMAVDARDALSRTLTTKNAEGVMYGSALGISANVLHDAPANATEEHELALVGGTLKIKKQGAST